MNIEDIRLYALSLPEVLETFPFGDNVLVFKVNNKVFLLLPLDGEGLQFNVKCDPEYALELREQYASVKPGYHMNKKHWNTVVVDGTLTVDQIKNFISASYYLVNKKKRS